MKRLIATVLACCVAVSVTAIPAWRTDSLVSLSIHPHAILPLSSDPAYFTTGAGAAVSADIPLPFFPSLALSVGVGYELLPIWTGGVTNLFRVTGGASLLLGTLAGSIGPELIAAAGYYYGMIADSNGAGGNAYFTGGLRAGWSFSPSFEQGIEARYEVTLDGLGGILHHGVAIGLSTRVNLLRHRELELEDLQFDRVFPVLYKRYTTVPFGTVTVRNAGAQPIHDLAVTFYVDGYMDTPWECPAPPALGPGENAPVELLALFDEGAVLAVTEATVVTGTVVATYAQGDREYRVERSAPLRLLDRHAITWDDDRKPAAYVTYKDPTLIDIGSVVARVANDYPGAVDRNLRIAMALHEGFRAYGLTYRIDPATPFVEYSQSTNAVDYLQFPRNTLDRRAGDCDDLSILYAAALEAVGVETAFITIPGHIYIGFALEAGPDEARRMFSDPDSVIMYDGRAWIPLEVTMTDASFADAWRSGASEWAASGASGSGAIYPLADAWSVYEPVGQVGEYDSREFPSASAIEGTFGAEFNRFVEREIYFQTERLQKQVDTGRADPRTLNRIGAVYARYGRYDDAREYFLASIKDEPYLPSLVNLASTAMAADDLDEALAYLEQAETQGGNSATLFIQLARVHNRLGNFTEAGHYFERAAGVDSDLAARYSYLDPAATPAARASGRQALWEVMPWVEE